MRNSALGDLLIQMRKIFRLLGYILAILCGLCSSSAAEPIKLKDYFPLSKGTVWIYEGMVKWNGTADKKPDEKLMRWSMEVIDTFEESFFSAALLRGHPSDLMFYDPNRKPSEYVIVNSGGMYFELNRSTWSVLQQPDGDRSALMKTARMILDAPLIEGKRFCEPEQILVQVRYCWNITQTVVQLKKVRGLPPSLIKEHRGYDMTFQTSPDHTIVVFVPGLGITGYLSAHHSSDGVAVDLSLIEYRPGKR